MNDWSRRNVLRAGAGVAAGIGAAVPIAAIGATAAHAAVTTADGPPPEATIAGPVVFAVHDAAAGEVSILHGEREVVVVDRRLVARLLRAASTVPAASIAATSDSPSETI